MSLLHPKTSLSNFLILSLLLLLSACSTIPVEDRESVRQNLLVQSDQVLAKLIEQTPEVQTALTTSLGYFVGKISAAQVAIIGGGDGRGVLHTKADDTDTFININRFDVGAGLSASSYHVVIFFYEQDALERFSHGSQYASLVAESALGSTGNAVTSNAKGVDVYYLAENGAAISLTTRMVNVAVNTDLTDVGLADVSIPNTKFNKPKEKSTREWNRALPFLAQKVIDEGYDLPLPYGFGLTYANIEQSMNLDDLEVGINGREEIPFEFVTFANSIATNDTLQVKFDTWLFPFMNVFALLGKVEGTAELDIWLDGNGMLDHIETECEGLIKPPTCKLLEDKEFLLPIKTQFTGSTYGIGTVLAGGWNDWFVTIPISIVYADMDNNKTEGLSVTFTPRFGRIVNLSQAGQLALYVGGNYLDTELTVSGTVGIDDLITLDYTIDQSTTDNWNTVVGANWDFTKKWSVHLEYNGFNGSRDAFISSLTYRF